MFFAAYEWGITNELRLIDYPTGNVLYSWTPSTSQAALLKNQRYVDSGYPAQIGVSYDYIAIITRETFAAPGGSTPTSAHLFIWQLVGEIGAKQLKLVSQTQIANILNPGAVVFDMDAAYAGHTKFQFSF